MILEEDRLELEGMKEHREIEKARLELVDKLMKHDIYDINHYQFLQMQMDDSLMEELKRQLVAKFYKESKDVEILNELRFLLSKMDKQIWMKIRKGKLSLTQLKMRVLEKMDSYKHTFTDFDDIKDNLLPSMAKIDHKKAEQYIKAAFGKSVS